MACNIDVFKDLTDPCFKTKAGFFDIVNVEYEFQCDKTAKLYLIIDGLDDPFFLHDLTIGARVDIGVVLRDLLIPGWAWFRIVFNEGMDDEEIVNSNDRHAKTTYTDDEIIVDFNTSIVTTSPAPASCTHVTLTINDTQNIDSIERCADPSLTDIGLGIGQTSVVQMTFGEGVDTNNLPELWAFVDSHEPTRLTPFEDGGTYQFTWDIRKSFENGTLRFGLRFDKSGGGHSHWIFSDGPGSTVDIKENCIDICFQDQFVSESGKLSGTFAEILEAGDPEFNCLPDGVEPRSGGEFCIRLFSCNVLDCSVPYDNQVFCLEWYDESDFSFAAVTHPGLAKQVFIASQTGVRPSRALSLTRSADAFDEHLELQYGSQKWMMVWDLELNRLIDFFPKQWLRHGAAMYFQHQTLKKETINGKSSRKPYYIEEVDLGLVFNAQGSFNLDRDELGQTTTNWDVPSRLIGLPRSRQQRGIPGKSQPDSTSMETLYAEFNQVSMDRFRPTVEHAIEAHREKFFQDRSLFHDHHTRQRMHDQIMFLTREVAEKMLRHMTDLVEQTKHLVDSFNPEIADTFGHFAVVLLNSISNKILRTRNDRTQGIFSGTTLESDEESSGDWLRYMYGELRRFIEMEKVDKKDVQIGLLEALANVDPNDPTGGIAQLTEALNTQAIKEQYELASNGRIPAGAGLVDPDTQEENRIRGLAK